MFFERFKSGALKVDQCARGLTIAQSAVRHKDGIADPRQCGQSLMSPLPFTSSMYEGCIETGIDVTRCGCVLTNKGVMILNLIVARITSYNVCYTKLLRVASSQGGY